MIQIISHQQQQQQQRCSSIRRDDGGEEEEEDSDSLVDISWSNITNHIILHSAHSHMLGEFYTRIFHPLVQLIHSVSVFSFNDNDNDNDSSNDSSLSSSSSSSSSIQKNTQLYISLPMITLYEIGKKHY
jgi:hypothetical protein